MRKLLLLTALCALGVLLFASAAMATSSATATATATAQYQYTASAAGAAQYQYASALPGTGGVVSPLSLLAIIPAIVLLGGALLSARLILRS
jgi:hypothetical protein